MLYQAALTATITVYADCDKPTLLMYAIHPPLSGYIAESGAPGVISVMVAPTMVCMYVMQCKVM